MPKKKKPADDPKIMTDADWLVVAYRVLIDAASTLEFAFDEALQENDRDLATRYRDQFHKSRVTANKLRQYLRRHQSERIRNVVLPEDKLSNQLGVKIVKPPGSAC